MRRTGHAPRRAAVLLLLGALAVPGGGAAQAPNPGAASASAAPEAGGLVPPSDSVAGEEGSWVAFPFLFYTPETGVGGGGVAGYYRRLGSGVETSSVITAVTVTARRQLILEWIPDAYLAGGGRVGGEVRYRHYPDVFYGVGPGTPSEAEEDYTSRVADLRARVQRRVGEGLRTGVETRLRHERIVSTEADGLLSGGTVRGSSGGTVVGVGALGTWDTRDNRFSPVEGRYVEGAWTLHHGALGSDFDFHRVVLDGRQFIPVGDAATLGLHAYLEATPGPAPFSLLPPLGGNLRMRGYREGRFRDRTLVTAQVELRFPLWRRFGGVAFVSAGDVAPRLGDLDLSSLEAAGGTGLRLRLNPEGVSLRADYGVGREGGQLYLTMGQAF